MEGSVEIKITKQNINNLFHLGHILGFFVRYNCIAYFYILAMKYFIITIANGGMVSHDVLRKYARICVLFASGVCEKELQ